jgi:hypothetical protein
MPTLQLVMSSPYQADRRVGTAHHMTYRNRATATPVDQLSLSYFFSKIPSSPQQLAEHFFT